MFQVWKSFQRLISDFATRKQVNLMTVSLSGAGMAEERIAKKYIRESSPTGKQCLSVIVLLVLQSVCESA